MRGMSIWILAFIVVAAAALAGWRQGAIRAAFNTVGILLAALLAVPIGHLVQPLVKFFGVSNPLIAWALVPVIGFMIVVILVMVAAQPLHKRVEHFYRYNAGDLRMALWERLNSRLGICLGVLNGVMYFVLLTFLVFHLAYVTTQFSTGAKQPAMVRLANQLGNDLAATGLSRTATGVGKLSPEFYQLTDLAGFVLQQKDPQFGMRLVEYPALTSLWQRDDMMPLVQNAVLTNALASGVTLGDLFADPGVQGFLENKDQIKMVVNLLTTNLTDLTNYLATGKSEKYSDKIIGRWEFNPAVTIAWLRQANPKIPASEMRVIRAQVAQAYAPTKILVTGDNQIFVKGLPKFKVNPGQPPTVENNDWKGDWTSNGNSYDLHLTLSGEDKYLTATAEDLRLSLKDGKSLLIFDRVD